MNMGGGVTNSKSVWRKGKKIGIGEGGHCEK